MLVPSNPCKAHLAYAHWQQLLKSYFMLFYLTPLSYSLSIWLRWKASKRKQLLHFVCVFKSWFENRVVLIIRIIHFLSTNTRVFFSLWSCPVCVCFHPGRTHSKVLTLRGKQEEGEESPPADEFNSFFLRKSPCLCTPGRRQKYKWLS